MPTDVAIADVRQRPQGILGTLRAQGCWIVALAPDADQAARVDLFDWGADHVLHGDFSVAEVAAQVRAIVRRRSSPSTPPALGSATVVFDPDSRHAVISGRRVALTAVESKLLGAFMAEPGRVIPNQELLMKVWGSTIGARSTISAHIRRLRLKIEPDPAQPTLIITAWGAGYIFRPGPEPEPDS